MDLEKEKEAGNQHEEDDPEPKISEEMKERLIDTLSKLVEYGWFRIEK